jgi:hypothetical protein
VLLSDPGLRLLLLSPEDWAEHAAFPLYGMPHYAGEDTIVVGDEPAGFWQGVVEMVDDVLTQHQRAEVEAVYGTVYDRPDMSALADLIAVHELGHLFHAQVPFAFPRLWLMELFANFCVHAYLADREPERLPLWTTLPGLVTALPAKRVRHRSLETFERLYVGVGPENYSWYQFKLAVGAGTIYDAAGAGALRRLYLTFRSREDDLTDHQLAEILGSQVHPAAARVMQTWPGHSGR